MKVVFTRQAISTAIALTQNAVNASGTLPILSNVLMEAQNGELSLVATDLDAFARVRIEARVEEAGRTTVPAKTLADIVKRLPDDDVAVVTSGSRMTLTCNRNVYHLATMPADDYPDWPRSDFSLKVTLRQADLRRLLHSTLFAVPMKDPRKVLMGVLFHLTKKGGLTCVATDGRKLGKAVAEPVEVVGKISGEINAIIPRKVLEEIEKAIGEEGEVTLALNDRQASFSLSNLTYMTSLIEGNFPKYEAVIPDAFKRTIDLPKTALDDAIVRAGVLAERKYNSIILAFGRNVIDIQAQSFEDGSYEGQVEITYDGEPFKIAFSHQYLHEVFKIIPDAATRMKIKDANSPVVFECEADPSSLFLVMPVRLNDLEPPERDDDEDDDRGEDNEDDDE